MNHSQRLICCLLIALPMTAVGKSALTLHLSGELRAYDAEDYRLAYDALLGVRDLTSALRIAQQAVKNAPQDLDWRRRLARVAEWAGQAELAWQQRMMLYQHGVRERETIEALLRLGVFFGEAEFMLELWLAEAQQRPAQAVPWEELRRLFERAVRPEEGARFFAERYQRLGETKFLDWAAQFAESAGQDEEALRLYRARAAVEPFSTGAVIAAAGILIRQGKFDEAHQWLMQFESRVADEDRAYWRLLGDTAWQLQDDAGVLRAYRRLLGKADADGASRFWRLIQLVQQKDAREAALLALESYRRHHDPQHLILSLQLAEKQPSLVERIFAAIDANDLPTLEADVRFLLLRANHHRRNRRNALAWQDVERALAIAPDDIEVATHALWFSIDEHDKARLAPMLARWRLLAEQNAALWLPYAAAYHALDRYREALPWYRHALARQPDDILLQLNYADLLERLELPGQALEVRRQANRRLQEKQASVDLAALVETGNEALLAQVRLAILDQPGDAAQQIASRIARHMRRLEEGREADAQVKDLVLAWLIGSEQYENARSWMWRNYLRREPVISEAPVWAQSQVVLRLEDSLAQRALLDRYTEAMPIYNRYDVAYALGDRQQALDIAFHGMEHNPVDEALYDRYRLHAPPQSGYLQLALGHERQGGYRASRALGQLHYVFDQRLTLDFQLSATGQGSRESALSGWMPKFDGLAGLQASWHDSRGDTRFAAFGRNELATFAGWSLEQSLHLGRRWELAGRIDSRIEATDSVPLRVGGQQSGFKLDLRHTLDKRDGISLSLGSMRYATQFGEPLGSGLLYDLGLTHRLRTEYPDWRLSATFSGARYRHRSALGERSRASLSPELQEAIAAGTLDGVRYFLPESHQGLGLCFGMGENLAGQDLRQVYSRGWRHFYDLCLNRDSTTGLGYRVDFGVVGSLTGEDHLLFSVDQGSGRGGNSGTQQNFLIRYRHYF